MYDFPDELGNVSDQLLWEIVNINIGAVTMMTRMLINGMKARGRGAIVNVSSGSELQPMPFMAVYAASKVGHPHFFPHCSGTHRVRSPRTLFVSSLYRRVCA